MLVNFDPKIIELVRETKCMMTMGLEVPEQARRLVKTESTVKANRFRLEVESVLRHGLTILNWSSLILDSFFHKVDMAMSDLNQLLKKIILARFIPLASDIQTLYYAGEKDKCMQQGIIQFFVDLQVKDMCEMHIEALLQDISTTVLIDLPEDGPSTLEDMLSKTEPAEGAVVCGLYTGNGNHDHSAPTAAMPVSSGLRATLRFALYTRVAKVPLSLHTSPRIRSKEWAENLDHKSRHVEAAVKELIDIFEKIYEPKEKKKIPHDIIIAGTKHLAFIEDIDISNDEEIYVDEHHEVEKEDEFEKECKEVYAYFSHQLLDALLKASRLSLDSLKRRIFVSVLSGRKGLFGHASKPEEFITFLKSEIHLAIPNVVMLPSLDDIQQAINRFVHLILEVTRGVAQWGQERVIKITIPEENLNTAKTKLAEENIPKRKLKNFYHSVAEHKDISKLVMLLTSSVNSLRKPASDVLQELHKFKVVWGEDRDDKVKQFMASNPSLTEIKSEILHYVRLEQEIEEIKPTIILGSIELFTGPLKMSLAVEAKAWKMLLCRYLNEEYKKKMLDMISFIGEHLKMLSRPLQDLDDVRFAMQALLEIRDTEIQIDMTLGPIEEAYSILNKFEVEVTKEEAEGVDTLRYSFIKLQSKARSVQDELVQVQPKFKSNLLKSVTIFQKDVLTFIDEYDRRIHVLTFKCFWGKSIVILAQLTSPFHQLKLSINSSFGRIQANSSTLESTQVGCPWKRVTDYESLHRSRKELGLLQKLYGLYDTVMNKISGYYDLLWTEVDIEKINAELLDFQNRCRKLPKGLKDWKAFLDLKKRIDDFSESCPILEMMANKSMKQRHWDRMADLTGHKFDVESDTFCLQNIMEAPLLKYKEDIEARFDDLWRKFITYSSGEQLFGLPVTDYESLHRSRKELGLLQKLYGLYDTVMNKISGYYDLLWTEVDIEKINAELLDFQNRCRKLPKGLKDWKAFLDLKKRIDDFSESCPILEMMANKSMKQRHWDRMADLTGHKFDVESDTFCLQNIMEAPLLKYKEDIEPQGPAQLTAPAARGVIQKRPTPIRRGDYKKFHRWAQRQEPQTKPQALITYPQDTAVVSQEVAALLQIQAIRMDICISAVKEKDIEAKLSQVVDIWSSMTLSFAAFKGRGELMLKGSETSEIVAAMEDSLMVLGSLLSNRYNAPFKKDIQNWVSKLSSSTDIIEQWLIVQNLWVYLEAVFVGGDIAKQLPQAHLLGVFDNVNEAEFHPKDYDRIISVISREGEKIPVGLLGIQMLWTRDSEEALNNAKDDKKIMPLANQKFLDLLNTLISQTTHDLTKFDRVKFETLVTIHVHQRDIFDDLVKMHIRSVTDFEWLKQSRFYFKDDVDQVIVSITDVDFVYQNEFLGCTDRLVITPLTDRCYITLSQALGMSMGGAPAGPAGTGKTETTKDMGKALGKYVVVFNCSDQMDFRGLGRIYKGLAQSGSWGCFDEFNRIDLAVLSVAAQQIYIVLVARKERIQLDGSTYAELQAAVANQVEAAGLVNHPPWNLKLVQLFETARVRHGLMTLGPSGSGKTAVTNILMRAMTECVSLHREMRMNPKAITAPQMFGRLDPATNDWTDGIFSTLWRKTLKTKKAAPLVQAIPGLLSPALPTTLLLPAPIKRFNKTATQNKQNREAWLNKRNPQEADMLQILYDKVFEDAYTNMRINLNPKMQLLECNYIIQTESCSIYDAQPTVTPAAPPVHLDFLYELQSTREHPVMAVAVSHSMDALYRVSGADKLGLTHFLPVEAPIASLVRPANLSLLSKDAACDWEHWSKRVVEYVYPEDCVPDYSSILVPNVDNIRTNFLMETIAKQNKAVLLTGEQGTAKTVMIKGYMKKFDPETDLSKSLNFSSATEPLMFQRTIESYVDKRMGSTYGPPGGRRMTVFIDDINMPVINEWGDQVTNEIVRQMMEMTGMYSLDKPGDFTTIVDVQLMAAMIHPGGGRNDIPQRLKRQFTVFNCTLPSNVSIDKIFGIMGRGYFHACRDFTPEISSMINLLVPASRILWQWTKVKMLPTPSKFHYIFNLRDLSRIWQGMLTVKAPECESPTLVLALFKSECTRVIADRFVSEEDKVWFEKSIIRVVQEHVDPQLVDHLHPEPYFVDFLKDAPEATGEEPEDSSFEAPKVYELIPSFEFLCEKLQFYQAQYNEAVRGSRLDLVFFKDAMTHLIKVYICKKGFPTEDRHGRCVACLGLEHAKEALADRSYCKFCASFSTRTLEKRVLRSSVERSLSVPPGQGTPPSSAQKGAVSSHESSVPRESRRTCRRLASRSSSSSPSPSPPPASSPKKKRKKSHRSHRSDSSEQLDKLWEVVSQQGNMLAELLREHTVTPAPSVPLQSQGVVHTEWQEEDLLSITASDEAVDREFPSEEGDSDSATPVSQVSLSAELLPLIKRATDILNVPWPVDDKRKHYIFDDGPALSPVSPPVHLDFLFEVHSSWGHPATAPAASRSLGALYRLHEAHKLGLADSTSRCRYRIIGASP
ncbi:UNVERIFIED_CONTAM: hypothetical protein FKN15_022452 [Acipenser sinensis]